MVLCTEGGGVTLYDGQVLQTLGTRDGLTSDVVRDFLQDEDGTYWFATQYGATRYRPTDRIPGVLVTEIIADQAYHPPFPKAMGPSDYSAGGKHDSDSRHADLHPPPLPEPLSIPLSQTFVRFTFQGLSLTARPDAMIYRYRLVDRDPNWRVTRVPEVTYERLSLGTYSFEVQAVDPELHYSQAATVAIEIVPDPRDQALADAFPQAAPSGEMVGQSAAVVRLQAQLRQVADTDATVLLTGATGTGKGLAARCVHDQSRRRDAPFVPVNCGAIALTLIESELFGHERGAFTGAHARKLGKVELAAGGSLLLDEIGEMSGEAQIRLLRLLEEKTFERVGGTKTLAADVRVIAATNRDLDQLVLDGDFREDLFFRLNVFPIELPPRASGARTLSCWPPTFSERCQDSGAAMPPR